MSEQKDRPDREKIILLLSSGMLRSGDALNGVGELFEDDTYLFLTKEYKGILADCIIALFPDVEQLKQNYEHLIKVKVRQAIRQTTKMFVSDIKEAKKQERQSIYEDLCVRCQAVLDGLVK